MQTSFVPSEVFSWTLRTISLHLADRKWEEGREMTHLWVNSHGRARFRWTSGGQADRRFSHSPARGRPELELRDCLLLAAVACRKLCLLFSVFSHPFAASLSREGHISHALSTLYQNMFCRGPNLVSSSFEENSEWCILWSYDLSSLSHWSRCGQSRESSWTLAGTCYVWKFPNFCLYEKNARVRLQVTTHTFHSVSVY